MPDHRTRVPGQMHPVRKRIANPGSTARCGWLYRGLIAGRGFRISAVKNGSKRECRGCCKAILDHVSRDVCRLGMSEVNANSISAAPSNGSGAECLLRAWVGSSGAARSAGITPILGRVALFRESHRNSSFLPENFQIAPGPQIIQKLAGRKPTSRS